MILAELHLHNYKQYHGEHHVEFPGQGIIAVIGANGVGKTTLFEAIEWCLYNPREIANDEVPPRGGVGHTCVRVVLEDPRDGARYVVERTLRRGVANGEVYREDRPEAPIVQGSRQVTDYVARRLIGLSHRAFVSTFFTRQKELTFFGNLKETDRRREVARLLGFDTIRDAQKQIGDDRNRARAEAEALRHQYEAESAGRDFPAELTAAASEIDAQEMAASTAETELAAAAASLAAARDALAHLRDLERRDGALARDLLRIRGQEETATVRRAGAEEALRRLDAAASARDALAALAATAAQHAATVAAHDAERDRAAAERRLRDDVARAEEAIGAAAARIKRSVAEAGPKATEIAGWTWTAADQAAPAEGARRLIAVVVGLDIDDVCARAIALATCHKLLVARDQELERTRRYQDRFAQLEAMRTSLLEGGDPAVMVAEARATREAALREAAEALTRAEAAATNQARFDPLVTALRSRRFEDRCPTCGRPFTAAEAELTLAALEDHQESLRDQEERDRAVHLAALRRAEDAERIEAAASHRLHQLADVNGRIEQALPHIRESEEAYELAKRRAAAALAEHGLDAEPTPESVVAAESRAALLQRLAGQVPLLSRLGEDAERAADEAAHARRALAELGPVNYDAAAHQAARDALRAANDAAARIVQIDEELAQRPGHETSRARAIAELAQLAAERARLEQERADVGFDETALREAIAVEEAALRLERAKGDALTAAQHALKDAIDARQRLVDEQARVADLARRAEERAREADELDRMYREFTRFDQYVAARVTPQLAEHTGELLAAVTDHKYDRVAFDENYGLKIYDEDECFPIEEFSGGERDVAALCARLALSRFVGGQAAHPPRFLVLDEVFGSLDQDRRTQVLETLGQLADSSEAFRQLFIVSHVEDVHFSAIVDEVWRISEVGGVSRFENLTRAGGLAEL